jgi:hypothetical protein
MISFKNQKNQEVIPKILGGLSIPSGVAIIFLFILAIPITFLPTFRIIKLVIAAFLLLAAYGTASFIDVKNKGISNLKKRLFSKKVTAIKIKSLKPFKNHNDTQR